MVNYFDKKCIMCNEKQESNMAEYRIIANCDMCQSCCTLWEHECINTNKKTPLN